MGEIVELLTSNDGNIRTAKFLLSTKNLFNCPLNLLYPLECEHEHRKMSREIPMIEQTDPNIKKNRGNKKLPVISSNVYPMIKTTQNLTLKEPQKKLRGKLKTE